MPIQLPEKNTPIQLPEKKVENHNKNLLVEIYSNSSYKFIDIDDISLEKVKQELREKHNEILFSNDE